MLLILFFLSVYNYIQVSYNIVWVGWLGFNCELVFVQICLLFILARLNSSINLYQLLGFGFVFISVLGAHLFLLQLDVFGCFLLVGESVIFLFILSMLIHLNINNLVRYRSSAVVYGLVIILILPTSSAEGLFSYYVDWYASQLSSYNDLIAQYLCFYQYHTPLLIFVGFWLLGLTFLLVTLATISTLNNFSRMSSEIKYVRQYQNLWDQWYRKPLINILNLFK